MKARAERTEGHMADKAVQVANTWKGRRPTGTDLLGLLHYNAEISLHKQKPLPIKQLLLFL